MAKKSSALKESTFIKWYIQCAESYESELPTLEEFKLYLKTKALYGRANLPEFVQADFSAFLLKVGFEKSRIAMVTKVMHGDAKTQFSLFVQSLKMNGFSEGSAAIDIRIIGPNEDEEAIRAQHAEED